MATAVMSRTYHTSNFSPLLGTHLYHPPSKCNECSKNARNKLSNQPESLWVEFLLWPLTVFLILLTFDFSNAKSYSILLMVQFPLETTLLAKKPGNSTEAVTARGEFEVWCMKPLKEIGSAWFGVMGDTTDTRVRLFNPPGSGLLGGDAVCVAWDTPNPHRVWDPPNPPGSGLLGGDAVCMVWDPSNLPGSGWWCSVHSMEPIRSTWVRAVKQCIQYRMHPIPLGQGGDPMYTVQDGRWDEFIQSSWVEDACMVRQKTGSYLSHE